MVAFKVPFSCTLHTMLHSKQYTQSNSLCIMHNHTTQVVGARDARQSQAQLSEAAVAEVHGTICILHFVVEFNRVPLCTSFRVLGVCG